MVYIYCNIECLLYTYLIVNTILTTGPRLNPSILAKELTIRGFFIYNWLSRWPEAFKAIGEWIDQVMPIILSTLIEHTFDY